ncbi:hypothetical protein LOCC1_G007085 [Lachnellula occidentalis]|uniref:Uncharacterized protein n=1 Tax=Lachnellula occidentalis TaxID=215460 RepID=A0A8H8U4M6_9HELO|nr:hypothetical protein LOCC1_G007085 [Lachnellula occidentalis]
MFAQRWATSRKRAREDDDESTTPGGFSEHRIKRRIADLPHRQSPSHIRQITPPFTFNTNHTPRLAPPTITPADSDSEEKPRDDEPKSFFSPFSSSPACTLSQSGPPSPHVESVESSQSTHISDAPFYSDDMEMSDSVHLSPGSFHNEPPMGITGRIPTPIHSSFAPFIRVEKPSIHHDVDFADDEAIVDKFRRARRLPSPISEGEMSPSVIVDGLGDMQMEVDGTSQTEKGTPTKKGHTRSKHSLRNWHGSGGDLSVATGVKRSFSMGYRADCEKCRMKVPGHFSHIITVD